MLYFSIIVNYGRFARGTMSRSAQVALWNANFSRGSMPSPTRGSKSGRLSESVSINDFSHISLHIPNIRHSLLFKPILWFGFWLGILLFQDDDDDGNEPLDMSWPDTGRKRLTYMLVAPILVPLWLTLPDTRTPKGKAHHYFVKRIFYHLILFENVFFIGTLGLKAPKIRSPQYVLYWPTKWKGWYM